MATGSRTGTRKAAPAKKTTAKKTTAKKTTATTTKASTAKKTSAAKSTKQAAAAKKTAATKKAASAKKAAPAKKAPAKKAPAKKAAPPAKKAPAKKAAPPAKKAPAKKAAPPAKKAPAKKAAAPAKKTAPVAKKAPVTVPKGSDWTKAELKAIRKELAAELAEMRTAYERSLQSLNELQQSSSDGAGDDQADAGSKTFDREQEQSIAANRLDLMTQIQHAVERIDAGTYGFCERCGKPIPKARLKAFPAATLDVGCKEREERR